MVPESLSTLPLDDANLPAATPKPQTPTERPATGHKSRKQKTRRNKSKNVVETAAEVDDAAKEVDGTFSRLGVRDDGSTGFWAALGSSDSEFSDVEHGSSLSVSHLKRNSSARVRLHSLACFHAFIKVTYFDLLSHRSLVFNPSNHIGCKTSQSFKPHKPERLLNQPTAVILM